MSNLSREEPSTAPKTDQWYDLVLGPSAKDDSSHKFCTLRYEFKPASIDKRRSGTLHKKKDNRVSVEFQNNQPGKPKVTFEGSSEDYKENDAVLFFDGEKFRLERLHRAVKQLRHRRTPDESAASSQSGAVPVEHRLSPVGRPAKSPHVNRSLPPEVPVEVERIEIGKSENSAEATIPANTSAVSPVVEKNDEDGEEHHEIDFVEIFGSFTPENENVDIDKDDADDDDGGEYVEDLNKQLSMMEEEIADVDDDTTFTSEGLNAAEALRAQVNLEVQKGGSSSSSSSSSSGSSSGSDSDGRSKSSGSSSGSSSRSRSRGSGGNENEIEIDDEDEVNSV
ncbi:unnamed protein product [Microthlaspi erraticum]|uniref:Transcription elongation factor Eaf N-terminal domain-containing protein n=1 Tax=Microthlaspi erraticum TaxID=1685480 RepID=A0A6D2KGN2_9BRAS|nr:unnamed protein product [Microthlaspi erraticum]